jgi:hypothetical protein
MNKDFGPIFWIHLVIVFFSTFAFLFFNYWILIGGAVLYQLQILVFGHCVLSKAEFKDPNQTFFHHHYLKKLGFNFDKRKLQIYLNYIQPAIVLTIGLILQLVLNFKPLIY